MQSLTVLFKNVLLTCTLTLCTHAQQINNQRPTNVVLNDIRTQIERFNENDDANIKGSPYINDEFSIVKISQVKDSTYYARYNAFTHEMQIQTDTAKTLALDASVTYEVKFLKSNKTYKSLSYVNRYNITVNRFLVVLLENDKCSLYKEEHIEYHEKEEATTNYGSEKPARYERADDVYFIKINNELKPIPTKKKQFLKFFPNKEKELKSYMKDQKLNPKNEVDLIKIIEYLTSIL
ncbi:hypothetical protein BWZ20_10700 [Winogradskyella sp. J14-2]|uniref:hypothetical protein n=1 Tax=Winogradskyella sp. J14-2 TaxID=1936080 RepID=UPI0009729AAB|nr:hypothetical protein [Winogradskyella sp. J14-2]APY08744.1 hypothetical protein BWZ20_10700 [Winogradskyella sp. J14-2]